MSFDLTESFQNKNTAYLVYKYNVSPDIAPGSIASSTTGGRSGTGSVVFTPGPTTNGFSYPLYYSKAVREASARGMGAYVVQGTQPSLGGRLFTFVDQAETIFGQTTQAGLNILPSGQLRVVRAAAQGSGIILRGVDQGGDSQVVSLGDSTNPIPSACYLECWVDHVNNLVYVYIDNQLFFTWSGNTAISGRQLSSLIVFGGYASNGPADQVRHSECLDATLSNIVCINNIVDARDSRLPTFLIGAFDPSQSLPIGDVSTAWNASPAGPHFANLDEIPPDQETTMNTTNTVDQTDKLTMQTGAVTTPAQSYIAYEGFVRLTGGVSAQCVSGNPAEFEELVWMESEPGTCQTGPKDSSACDLSNAETRRGQSKCTISQDGDSVTFKPNVNPTGDGFDGFWVGLSPLDAPPVVWNRAANLPGEFMQLSLDGNGQNIAVSPGRAEYVLPWFQPWAGYAYSTTPSTGLSTSGDYIQFKVSGTGAHFDVGFIDHTYNLVLDPYSSVVAAIHFREDTIGVPFFFCGTNFTYNGESVFSYADGDTFKILRQDPDIKLYQNGVLKATITPGGMPAHLYPYMLAGRWGYSGGSYSIPPAIYNAVAQIGTSTCIVTSFRYNCVRGYNDLNYDSEFGQWGIGFTDFTGHNRAQIIDGAPHVGVDFFPTFDYGQNTTLTFALVGGNVVLRIRNAVLLNSDGSPNFVTLNAHDADFTYSRPYSQTNDFSWQPNLPMIDKWYRVGLPVWPFEYLQSDFINNTTHQADANLPLRLMVMVAGDNDYALPYKAGINSASFTFA